MGYFSNNIKGQLDNNKEMLDKVLNDYEKNRLEIKNLEHLSEDVMTVKQMKILEEMKKNYNNNYIIFKNYKVFFGKPQNIKEDLYFYLNKNKKLNLSLNEEIIENVFENSFNVSFETKFDIRSELKQLTKDFKGYINLIESNTYEEDGYEEVSFKDGKEKKGLYKPQKDEKKIIKNHQYFSYYKNIEKEHETMNGKYFELDYTKKQLIGSRPYGKIESFRLIEIEHVMLFNSIDEAKLFNDYIYNKIENMSKSLFEKNKNLENDFKKRKEILEKYDLKKIYFPEEQNTKLEINKNNEDKFLNSIFQPEM